MKNLLLILLLVLFTSIDSKSQTITANPDSGARGQTLSVALYGQNAFFTQGSNTPTVWFSNATSTLNLNSVTVLNDDSLYGVLNIPFDAIPGYYNVYEYNNFSGTITQNNGFFIELPPNNITGSVYNDSSGNCLFDGPDYFLPGRIIKATPGPYYASTDGNGDFEIYLDSGNYTLEVIDKDSIRTVNCPSGPGTYSLSLGSTPDSIGGLDFGFLPDFFCTNMTVSISTWAVRPCFINAYTVGYCNNGTISAQNSTIDVELPDSMTFVSTTGTLLSQNANILTFSLGTVQPQQCGSFRIEVNLSCDLSLVGNTYCVQAKIYPDSICAPVDTNWDKSSVAVEGECVGDSLACFSIYNTSDVGAGDMQGSSDYRIYENNVLVFTSSFQLVGGDSIVTCWTTNGNTIRIEADQRPGHPGSSKPRSNIETCGTPVTLGQIILVQDDDEDSFIDIDCHEAIASYDPNDKQVRPVGLDTVAHYIDSSDVLEYMIRFQNTGTDTAFKVVIRDTLSPYLNISTIQNGVSSHPYTFLLFGTGIMEFTFDNILLPDSNVNEPESHGFIKFKVSQVPGNPLGTVIQNRAGILFDFNLPIITNTIFNTIGDIDSIVAIAPPLSLTITASQTNASCLGGCDGSGTVSVSGCSGSYTYLWDDPGAQTTATATSLCAGTYSVVITDSLGCNVTKNIAISEPTTPLLLSGSSTSATCASANGTGSVVANGGTDPYAYIWNDPSAQTSATASGLTSGIYGVTVSDANFCTDSLSVLVSTSGVGTLSIASSDATCFGLNDGIATATITGGTAPFLYLWNDLNAQTSSSATGLVAGTYIVQVSDSNSCLLFDSITITEPLDITTNPSQLDPPAGQCIGTASPNAIGGTGVLTFSWNDSLTQTTATATALCSGIYTVTITDANACQVMETFNIVGLVGVFESSANADSEIKIFPNPNSGQFTITRTNAERINLLIYQIDGKKVLDENINEENIEIDITQLNKGIYYLQLKSSSNIVTKKVIVQ